MVMFDIYYYYYTGRTCNYLSHGEERQSGLATIIASNLDEAARKFKAKYKEIDPCIKRLIYIDISYNAQLLRTYDYENKHIIDCKYYIRPI